MGYLKSRCMLAGALFIALGLTSVAAAGEDSAQEDSRAIPDTRMRVAIDPETGEFISPPEPAPVPDDGAATQSLQRGAEGVDDLVEEVNPAGGYTVHLRRRFGGVARAQAAPAGVDVECEAGESPDHHHRMVEDLKPVAEVEAAPLQYPVER